MPIGEGAVISSPSAHARVLDLAAAFAAARGSHGAGEGAASAPRAVQRVLDVGCGSGYLTAALALLADGAEVVGIDRAPQLVARARAAARAAAVDMASRAALSGDLARGEWAQRLLSTRALRYVACDALDGAGVGSDLGGATFDLIVVGAAAPAPPPPLLALLARGGRMVIPLGDATQVLTIFDVPADGGELVATRLDSVAYAPLAPARDAGDGDDETDPAAVQRALREWQEGFKASHGRKPSRADMEADADASALLARFRAREGRG